MAHSSIFNRYVLNTSSQHRKTYGQFFTPPSVARLMLHWLMQHQPKTILDPAFGLGVFYRQLGQLNLADCTELCRKFIGYEIDPIIGSYCQDIEADSALTLIYGDYLDADIHGVDAIVCNPPYMRFQKFVNRQHVRPKLEAKLGYKLMGHSNIASVFLLKALAELNFGGRLAFIMPFEFVNTGYGVTVKQQLLDRHLLKQIILIENEQDLFPDALTTVCVLLCDYNGKPEPIKVGHISTQSQLDNIADFSQFYQAQLSAEQLPCQQKWSPILEATVVKPMTPEGFCSLSQYGVFKRGIATGANNFFTLKPSQARQLNLRKDCFVYCITKSRQIQQFLLTDTNLNQLIEADKVVYCLNVLNMSQPQVKAYIEFGEQCHYHERYLTKMRHPWYKLEKRQPAPLLVGVFYRGRFKVIRNFSQALNLTCFHGFYPHPGAVHVMDRLFLYLISDLGQGIVQRNRRQYGNGLNKFEPGDLNESLGPNPDQLQCFDEEAVARVLRMAQEDPLGAIALSNEMMQSLI